MGSGEPDDSQLVDSNVDPAEAPGDAAPESEWAPGTADPCADMPDTGYANDELCIEAPPPDVGYQAHFGPSDYDDPDDLAPYLLGPGEENVVCQYRYTPDFSGVRYSNEQHTRLREGTHHLIMWGANRELPDAPADGEFRSDGCQNPFDYLFVTGAQAALNGVGGVQDIFVSDLPENEGIAHQVHPNRSLALEMHYVNTTPEPILRESWINTIYTDAENVDTIIDPMFFIGSRINVPVGGSQIVTNDLCEAPPLPADGPESKLRFLGFTGHAHANTTRITAWINRAATGQREQVYEVFDWAEPLQAAFNTVDENPPMNGRTDGGRERPALHGARGHVRLGMRDPQPIRQHAGVRQRGVQRRDVQRLRLRRPR